MNRLKTAVLVTLMAVGGVLLPTVTQAPEAAALDVYTTPGTHTLNGRQWKTTCAAYSPTIDRCRTEIFATQITRDAAGRFSQANGWAFNNLTYKPVAHKLWGANPLANPGEWTEGGRRWRTECGTAATGKDGCRSYIHGTAYTSVGGRVEAVNQWMFNNIVRVTPGSMKVGLEADQIRQAPAFLHGRRFFTLGTIITDPNEGGQARGTGRLSQVELDPGGQVGTFRESHWSFTWDMARESDYGAFRTSIGNRPTGCTVSAPDNADRTRMGLPALPAGTCDVRAARSFTAKPTVRYGTYDHSGGNRLRLFWNNSFTTETYLDTSAPGAAHSELRLAAHTHQGSVNALGFMFGSTKAPAAGRSMVPETQKQPPWLPPRSVNPAVVSQSLFPSPAGGADKTLWVQNLATPALLPVRQSFQFRDYQDAGRGCIVTKPEFRGRVSPSGWHSYFCPLADNGKLVWHHMAASLVAEGHGLCGIGDWSKCAAASPQTVRYGLPARAGGHVYAGLQLIDDDNELAAIVGLETSMYNHKASSQSAMALFAAVSPDS
ncbi:hypothetical protein H5392_08065 [Tessaracoccus sp. MC1865]|uniref:hypothetical protein n=1 Tax=Tessaracoccus sp. MC1865 TaxID=2760310 RepID=UPI001602F917|nr:hypothetical protein [Tessaracoccus sp. MC1865]MBB1483813.1 hypothetical protein [Tessaracoccus sp. MC1865]QTO36875.1 hypothetical protein J7D54_10435 [Tessaracoccus sp. MC1865]